VDPRRESLSHHLDRVPPQHPHDPLQDAEIGLEAWIMQEVGRGVPLPGLYPMNAETKARYEASKKD